MPLAATGHLESFETSFSQERLWLLDRIEAKGPSYNIAGLARIRGTFRREIAVRAFDHVVARHESLRTTFEERDGRPRQIVHPTAASACPRLEWVEPEDGKAGDVLEERFALLARKGFDLDEGPLLRVAVVRTGADAYSMVVVFHHIVSDGWSLGLLLYDFCRAYEECLEGKEPSLPELEIQYVDYAAWQREKFSGDRLDAALSFWKGYLEDAPPWLDLPTDRGRTHRVGRSAHTPDGALYQFRLEADVARGLKAIAKREGSTLFMALFALYATLLYRCTGQTDLVVGTPVANRPRMELEGVIGCFVNTVPLRLGVDPERSYARLLHDAKAAALAAFSYEETPFAKIVEAINPPRDPSRTPLFQTMIALQHTPLAVAIERAGFSLESEPLDTGAAQFDFAWEFTEDGEGRLLVDVEYSTALFDRSSIAVFAGHFGELARAAASDPDRPLAALPLETVDSLISSPPVAPDIEDVVVDVLRGTESMVTVAVDDGDVRLTYGELRSRALAVASALGAAGAGPETFVALSCDRCVDWIVGIVGILVSGAAFVPIDPALPRSRAEAIVSDAAPRAILVSRAHAPRFSEHSIDGARRLCIVDEVTTTRAPLFKGPVDVSPLAAAYVIYTSGSTGTPKGVVVSRGALARYGRAMRETYGLGEADHVLQFASFSFDVSLEEVFPALLARSTLVARPREVWASLAEFFAFCEERSISVVNLPTAYWRALDPKGPHPRIPSALRLVVVGSEAAYPSDVPAWLEPAGVRMCNVYGPTETTVGATMAELTGESVAESTVPIGLPIAGARCYVLDAGMRPVPRGAFGELHIGGKNLARGYLGRPDLTAERFVPDPFSPDPGALMYRTGDVVQRLRTGALRYVSRVDRQVKIRGFRVELDEITHRIRAHQNVEDAFVRLLDDARLVAYLACPGAPVEPKELLAQLRDHLPAYMVPHRIVVLESLPRNTSGKVDWRALPLPPDEDATGVAPRSAAELAMAELWRQLLPLEHVSVDDDFFRLGGHSLLAVQMVTKIRDRFQVAMSVQTFLERPTIRALVEWIERGGPSSDGDSERRAEAGVDPAADSEVAFATVTAKTVEGPWAHVLVTGATGFLGAYLVRELLAQTRARVTGLVRAESPAAARSRLLGSVASLPGWDPAWESRLDAVPFLLDGDDLGLSPSIWHELSSTADAIFHNAAAVSFVSSYARLRSANVGGTKNVVRLAQARGMAMVHVSTLSVFPLDRPQAWGEDSALPDWRELSDGYAQSKWGAERVVARAAAAGLRCTLFRPDIIVPDWDGDPEGESLPAQPDWLTQLTIASLRSNQIPSIEDFRLQQVPVSFVARAIVSLAVSPHEGDVPADPLRLHHLVNTPGSTMRELTARLQRHRPSLRVVAPVAWRDALPDDARVHVPQLGGETIEAPKAWFEAHETKAALERRGVVCPELDDRYALWLLRRAGA